MNGINDGEPDILFKCFMVQGNYISWQDSKIYKSYAAARKRCKKLNDGSSNEYNYKVLAASGWHEPMEAEE